MALPGIRRNTTAGLVFPRNETYEPGELMPIVFGLHGNPIWMLHPLLRYTLSGDGADQQATAFRPNNSNFVGDDLNIFLPQWTEKFAKEGQYRISWTIDVQQCNDPNTTKSFFYGGNNTSDDILTTYFTVKTGGKPRNVTVEESCHAGPGVIFNTTGILGVHQEVEPSIGEPVCAAFDKNQPAAPASSCNIVLNAASEQHLSYYLLTSYQVAYCNLPNPPKVALCPRKNGANGTTEGLGTFALLLVLLCSLFTY